MIKVSLLNSLLHESNDFASENKAFIQEISNYLQEEIVLSPLDDYDCDLKLIFIASGGSEGLFLKALPLLKEPYYLLTTSANNSLPAALEIMTYLNNHHLDGEVLHGSCKYISERIKNLNQKLNYSKPLPKLGVIGKPSDWLIASIPDYEAVKNHFGIELVDIDLEEVVTCFNKVEVGSNLDTKGFDQAEYQKALKFKQALDMIINKYQLSGLTIRCFDLLFKIHTTGCLALSMLNDEGIIATCEGDIMAMIGMYLIQQHYGVPSFQANPAQIDVDNKSVIFAHCTIPCKMCSKYHYESHFESKTGLAIKGELPLKKVGVLRLSQNLSDYFFEVGVIKRNLAETNLCRTQIEVVFNNDISVLLQKPCGNHHLIFFLD